MGSRLSIVPPKPHDRGSTPWPNLRGWDHGLPPPASRRPIPPPSPTTARGDEGPQWRSYRGGGARGAIAPPPLALENGKFGNLPSGGKSHPTTVRFWILTTSYVDMYGSVIGICLKKIFFIFPTFFSIKLTLISIKSTFSPLFNFCFHFSDFFSR